VNRAEAEIVADEMHEASLKIMEKHGKFPMTEQERIDRKVPDIRDRLREAFIESLMETELSEEGQRKIDQQRAYIAWAAYRESQSSPEEGRLTVFHSEPYRAGFHAGLAAARGDQA
jgi:hypothetical protein